MTATHSLKILVADDTLVDRMILENIVRKEGHAVISASNGLEAVEKFVSEKPDIVLLDALMPLLDGFGAAEQIKAIAGEHLVPIIFLTSLQDTESLVRCLDAGGDDFLSKPYNRVILSAKIKSFNRMRELHATMLEQRDLLTQHHERLLKEQVVAKQVFDNVAHSGCLNASNVRYFLSPLAVFNGDVMLAGMKPNGNMLVLLGDFTGHGLPAAIGAMPLASTFYGMVQKGFSMADVLREVNKKLKGILPVGIFCCATMLDINFRKKRVRAWNGGLPAGMVYHAHDDSHEPIQSNHLPLGVLPDKNFKSDFYTFNLEPGDRIFLWSDGIHEARNLQGEMFGEARLHDVFHRALPADKIFDQILGDVKQFVGANEQDDDLSIVEIRMDAQQIQAQTNHRDPIEWDFTFEVKPISFKSFDPLPFLLSILMDLPDLRGFSGSLYLILAELYSNALEHGVLGLSSDLKKTTEGFMEYYQRREKLLSEISEGYVRIQFHYAADINGGTLCVQVEDSGPGFDYSKIQSKEINSVGYSGRGISLVTSMCKSIRYLGPGNLVQAVFEWENDD